MFIPLTDLKQMYNEGRFYFPHDNGKDYAEVAIRTYKEEYCIRQTIELASGVRVVVSIVPSNAGHCQLTLEGQEEPFFSDYLPIDVPRTQNLYTFTTEQLRGGNKMMQLSGWEKTEYLTRERVQFLLALADYVNETADDTDLLAEITLGAAQALTETGGEYIDWAFKYAEPGYTVAENRCILFADWNDLGQLASLLESAGHEVEWNDEWATCECGKAFRISGDSYNWQGYYIINGDGFVCGDCILEEIEDSPEWVVEDVLDDYVNNHRKALPHWINPNILGWVNPNGQYENGFHPGQNDSPETIGQCLFANGIDYLFGIDSVGQFDLSFFVFVRENDKVRAGEALERAGLMDDYRSPYTDYRSGA